MPQLDLEMSFASGEDVMQTIEGVVRRLWSNLMKDPAPEGPFRRLSYEESMSRYGSDKPDTRFGMEISRIDYLLPVDLVSKITPLSDPYVEVFKIENNENDPAAMQRFITEFLDSPAAHHSIATQKARQVSSYTTQRDLFVAYNRLVLKQLSILRTSSTQITATSL